MKRQDRGNELYIRCTSEHPDTGHTMYTVGMTSFPLRDARMQLGEIVADVRRTQEPAIITRHGRPEVVILDIEDWQELQTLRDAADAAYIRQRIAAGDAPITLDDVVRQYDVAAGAA